MTELPTLPFAVYDEFGRGADDRVQDYGRACWQAALASRDAEIAQLREDAERYTCAKTLEGQVVVMETLKNLGASYLDEKLDELIVENAAIDALRAKEQA
jgi:hypothetical protein